MPQKKFYIWHLSGWCIWICKSRWTRKPDVFEFTHFVYFVPISMTTHCFSGEKSESIFIIQLPITIYVLNSETASNTICPFPRRNDLPQNKFIPRFDGRRIADDRFIIHVIAVMVYRQFGYVWYKPGEAVTVTPNIRTERRYQTQADVHRGASCRWRASWKDGQLVVVAVYCWYSCCSLRCTSVRTSRQFAGIVVRLR